MQEQMRGVHACDWLLHVLRHAVRKVQFQACTRQLTLRRIAMAASSIVVPRHATSTVRYHDEALDPWVSVSHATVICSFSS